MPEQETVPGLGRSKEDGSVRSENESVFFYGNKLANFADFKPFSNI